MEKIERFQKAVMVKDVETLREMTRTSLVSESWGASTPGYEIAKRSKEFSEECKPFWQLSTEVFRLGFDFEQSALNGQTLWLVEIED